MAKIVLAEDINVINDQQWQSVKVKVQIVVYRLTSTKPVYSEPSQFYIYIYLFVSDGSTRKPSIV